MEKLKKQLQKKYKTKDIQTADPLPSKDQQLIASIRDKTEKHNINNVTRTKAYLDFYLRHPEIEWAFLGHMVSRNGGWNMTDLKGEFLAKLLTEKEQMQFFSFLERGNWLIFQDIYPQFLLYEESLTRQQPHFSLLPHLNVSTFMEVAWPEFWKNENRTTLALAMIINEQSYLEKRVIQHPEYQNTVLNTIMFKLQDLLNMSHIIFPYPQKPYAINSLVGRTLNQFSSLPRRIGLGKQLYAILFSDSNRLKRIMNWAVATPHTGSRKDYWPHIFNDVKETLPGQLYIPQTKKCMLQKGSQHIYSPRLEYAWKNSTQAKAEAGDWFTSWSAIDYLEPIAENINGEIKHDYCETIEKLEWTVFTKKVLFQRQQ
ncbi:DUF2515 family protein [Halobacillus sp. H74]|uniref:DUF2515 family protein n=1 Tax=Halobacillus sp. H74 TaxID=3457436 RepID=UPI003FCCA2CE